MCPSTAAGARFCSATSTCLFREKICDNHQDCPDDSDETNCSAYLVSLLKVFLLNLSQFFVCVMCPAVVVLFSCTPTVDCCVHNVAKVRPSEWSLTSHSTRDRSFGDENVIDYVYFKFKFKFIKTT